MKRFFACFLAISICTSFLVACDKKKTDDEILKDVSIPSVKVTETEVTPTECAEPDYPLYWSEIEGLPADFPVLCDQLTAFQQTAASVSLKWNVLSADTAAAYVAKIGKWAGTALSENSGYESVTYSGYKNVDNVKYDISFVYQSTKTGSYISEISDWETQATLYIYKSKVSASSAVYGASAAPAADSAVSG